MKTRRRWPPRRQAVVGIVLLAACTVAAAGQPPAAALALSLKDQYEHETRLGDPTGGLLLLVYGDRLGSDFMGAWIHAVGEHYQAVEQAITIVRVANLHAVPAFFQPYVKGKFRTKNSDGSPNLPVLLDWDGLLAKTYSFRDDLTNVYLIDDRGVLRYQTAGQGLPEETELLFREIDKLRRDAAKASQPGGSH